MKALVTGASSGIGREFSIYLSNLGYDLILVARNIKELKETEKLCSTNCKLINIDLSNEKECINLFNENKDIDILINNAGFGLFGAFDKTNLNKELDMINVNVKAVHILSKLYLKEMIKKDSGRILNVASIAAFLPGPLMNTYYSTKSYVFKFTMAIYEELRRNKSNVKVSVLCPGPIDTNFNNVADVKFKLKGMNKKYVAKYTIDKMFKNKLIIIPSIKVKLGIFLSRFISYKMQAKIDYKMQKRKEK